MYAAFDYILYIYILTNIFMTVYALIKKNIVHGKLFMT